MRKKYQDKRKTFIKKVLRNIDYLADVSDVILEEMTYMLEPINITVGSYLFKRGTPCKEIYIICNGQLDVYIGNSKRETIMDTLYTGCTLGSYYILTNDDYVISAKTTSDCTLFKLTSEQLINLRADFEQLDENIIKCEDYVALNGLPYCDYKMYRTKMFKSSPISKFKVVIKRVINIVRTFKSSALQDLLERVRQLIQEKKERRESRKKSLMIKNNALTGAQKNEQTLLILQDKIEGLEGIVRRQSQTITNLKNSLLSKFDQVIEATTGKKPNDDSSSNSNQSSPQKVNSSSCKISVDVLANKQALKARNSMAKPHYDVPIPKSEFRPAVTSKIDFLKRSKLKDPNNIPSGPKEVKIITPDPLSFNPPR